MYLESVLTYLLRIVNIEVSTFNRCFVTEAAHTRLHYIKQSYTDFCHRNIFMRMHEIIIHKQGLG